MGRERPGRGCPAAGARRGGRTRCAPCSSTRRASAATRDDYYDPRNSFLNDVLDRRTGIPITPLHGLHRGRAARRASTVEGVGAARATSSCGSAARRRRRCWSTPSTAARCCRRGGVPGRGSTASSAGGARWTPRMLAPCAPRADPGAHAAQPEGHLRQGATTTARALRVCDLLLELDPERPRRGRDRGLLYAALGLLRAWPPATWRPTRGLLRGPRTPASHRCAPGRGAAPAGGARSTSPEEELTT